MLIILLRLESTRQFPISQLLFFQYLPFSLFLHFPVVVAEIGQLFYLVLWGHPYLLILLNFMVIIQIVSWRGICNGHSRMDERCWFIAIFFIKKLKINKKMAELALECRKIHATKSDVDQNTIVLVIPDMKNPNEGCIVRQQIESTTSDFIVFEIESHSAIKPESIMETINIKCLKEGNKFLIPRAEYKLILSEINKDNQENARDDSDSESEDSSSEGDEGSEEDSVYFKKCKIESYQHDSENGKSFRKGRGRPKGSKNKKTLLKEQQIKSGGLDKSFHIQQLHSALSGKIKRGKGRPKGSKNKPKMAPSFIKKETQENMPFAGKRGKGRPKGSKNKIKVAEPPVMSEQNKAKRGRGRPPGAKNKPISSPEISSAKEESQPESAFLYTRPNPQQISNTYCCRRCEQCRIKHNILEGLTLFEDGIDEIGDVFSDVGLQNKENLFLQIIQEEDHERLQLLLDKIDDHEPYFKSPWPVQGICQKNRFEVRTKKQFLSQSGKEGMNALLHDGLVKKELWWKRVGVLRIIESLSHTRNAQQVLKMLMKESQALKQQIFNNLSNILRCGNNFIAQSILKQMLISPSSNKYNYSQEHLDLLNGNLFKINQYKKFNLIKHNDGSNFCSPIHCAAVTHEPEFLQKLLQHFTDVVNAEDSMERKPIHYASASNNRNNLRALVQHGAELRELDKKKMTPLMIASYYGIAENVEYILEKVREHSYINFRSEEGYSALHYAILKSQEECVQLLLNDPFIKFDSESKESTDIFHLVAMTGNCKILSKLLSKWGSALSNSVDTFKKTPAMFAIRNHNNQMLFRLLSAGCKHNRSDTSLNSLLHYAAAYGNVEAILLLRDHITQAKNKRGYYPWELAIMKGHLGCAKLLGNHLFEFKQDPLFLLMTNIRGTDQYFECLRYVTQNFNFNIKYQDPINYNTYLHLICSINEEDYLKQRSQECYFSEEEIREEYNKIQNQLIVYFIDKGLSGYTENKKKQSPLKQCIENANLIGFQKLLTEKISFDIQSAQGSTILHRLSNLACKGIDEIVFVEAKLKEATVNDLRINLKKIDQSGFDFLLYFVKNFTETIKSTFNKWVRKYHKKGESEEEAQKMAFNDFTAFESKFMNLVTYLMELGCDVNAQVVDKRTDYTQSFRKWGIQHFLMKFPSLKLIKFFKNKIRDFNAQNNNGMTPLHLFCKNIIDGNLLSTKYIKISKDYEAESILEYLLANGLNPNTTDCTKSLPILYATLNSQYKFIMILLKHKSEINQVNSKNQVPFIEIIKNHSNYSLDQIENILKKGAKPSLEDMDKRNALHHLVACSSNFDSSPQVCKLLLDNNIKINSLDKYGRSPIFYCFDPDDLQAGEPNDKVQVLQVMMNLADINLNLLDVYKRSVVHYACRKNYFYSILYLLDRNINMQIVDHEENTPLAICLRHRNLDQAAFIIRKGVRYGLVNDPSAEGPDKRMSYFAYAIKNLSVGICFMLLDHGYPIQRALEEVPNEVFKEILKKKYIK